MKLPFIIENEKRRSLSDWTWYKLTIAEGDEAKVTAVDLTDPDPNIRNFAKELKPLTDEERFKQLRKMMNKLRGYTNSMGPG